MANVWLHPNVPGSREPSDKPPLRMELFKGIFLLQAPPEETADERPRLPLLGFRAFHRANLSLTVDFRRRRLSIRGARWFSWFGKRGWR